MYYIIESYYQNEMVPRADMNTLQLFRDFDNALAVYEKRVNQKIRSTTWQHEVLAYGATNICHFFNGHGEGLLIEMKPIEYTDI